VSDSPEVVPIFATPFGVVSLPVAREANAALAAVFSARALPTGGAAAAGAHAMFRSPEDLLQWTEPAVVQLIGEMLTGVTSFATSISELTAEQFASLQLQARGRFTIIANNGYLSPDSYPNTSWVALYCVAAPPPSAMRHDSGVLRLHELRPGAMFVDSAHGTARMPYRPGHVTWRPIPGKMAVFPATITHEIALLRAESPLILVWLRIRFVGAQQPWMPPW
jgi:hypothetical protein